MFALGCGGPQSHVDDSQRTATFDQQELVRVIQAERHQIQACYERALRSEPTLRGRMEVALTIETDGSMSRVRMVNSGALIDAVGECVVGVIRTFRVEHAPQGGTVSYTFPFVFEPQQ